MIQKEEFFVKYRTKKKNEEVFAYKKIDIFEIHDQNNISLGEHIEKLESDYDKLSKDFYKLQADYIEMKKGLISR